MTDRAFKRGACAHGEPCREYQCPEYGRAAPSPDAPGLRACARCGEARDLAPDGTCWPCAVAYRDEIIEERRGNIAYVVREAMMEWDADKGPQDEWIAARLAAPRDALDVERRLGTLVSLIATADTEGDVIHLAVTDTLRAALASKEPTDG